ncbi:MAG: flagellar export chaperone FliS [Planctomycetota bacterium]|nr:flagellar export chaperone FliS [Planctomycetota bacterium]
MMNSRAQAYLRTKVMSASPAELRLMLVDGAIRFAEQCRTGLQNRDFEQAFEGSRQCRAILTELLSGLKPEHDPLLCERLNSLYTFMISRMMEAMSERDHEIVASVVELLRFERETWQMVVDQLAQDGASDTAAEQRATEATTPSSPLGGNLHLAG